MTQKASSKRSCSGYATRPHGSALRPVTPVPLCPISRSPWSLRLHCSQTQQVRGHFPHLLALFLLLQYNRSLTLQNVLTQPSPVDPVPSLIFLLSRFTLIK